MPDHFHLLIYIPETRQTALSGQTGKTTSEIISRKIGTVLSSFTQAINKQELRVGSLFQPKTKAKEVDAMDHLEAVFHYIHQNPIRAGLTKEIQDWRYSSFFEFFNESFNLVDKDIVNQFLELDLRPNNLLKQSKSMIPDYIINPFIN